MESRRDLRLMEVEVVVVRRWRSASDAKVLVLSSCNGAVVVGIVVVVERVLKLMFVVVGSGMVSLW